MSEEKTKTIYTHVFSRETGKITAVRFSFEKEKPKGFVVGVDFRDLDLLDNKDVSEMISLLEKKIKEKLIIKLQNLCVVEKEV